MTRKTDTSDKKTVDLPPRGARNPDPITDAPGAHPIETGVGAAVGGAATGAALGTMLGPAGVIAGAIAGGIAGGLAGKGVGELIDPTTEDNWIREWIAARDVKDEQQLKAYRFGLRSKADHMTRTFDEAAPTLRTEWERQRADTDARWEDVTAAVREGFEKAGSFHGRLE